MPATPTGEELERLRRHFEIERQLADRLRRADPVRRRILYRAVYDELHQRVDLVGNAEAQRAQVDLLLELLAPYLEGADAFIEIGAGTGDLSLAVADRVPRVWAVDAVVPGIADPPEGFTFVADDALDSAIPDGVANVALSCHFVEHLHPDDVLEHLATVRTKLRRGGAYVVVTPNRLYGPHDVSRHFSDVPLGLHLCEMTHLELAAVMRRAGFGPVHVIGRLGEAPGATGWGRVAAAERVLGALPARLRRWLLDRAPRSAPFRPLEQVKLVGFAGAAR